MAPIVGFDTNIVIPALLFPGRSPLLCVSMARNERIQSVTCQEILDEFSEKLIVKFTLSEEKTEEIIEEVCQFSRIVRINQELTLVSADPDDDMIIENLGLKPRRFTAALLLNISTFTKYMLKCEIWKKPILTDFTPHQNKSRYCGALWAV